MKNTTILLAAAVLAVVLATCGDDSATPDETVPTTPASTVGVGSPSGIEVEEPGIYTGFLFADETGVYLVKTLAESFPPQAVGPLRPVEGIQTRHQSALEGVLLPLPAEFE